MRLTARLLLLLTVFMSLPLVIAAPGCSGQGEGERCDVRADNNGTEDCAGDLVCIKAGDLNGSNTDRCCPADRTGATTDVCKLPTAGGIDGAPPPDAGPSPDATSGDAPSDAPSDSPTPDAPTDSASDAPSDAPEDAG